MICVSIQNKNLEEIIHVLDEVEMAEIRLDRCQLSDEDINVLFSVDLPLVATCRISEIAATDPFLSSPECNFLPESKLIKAAQTAEKKLAKAIEAGARFVDLELEAPKQMSKRLANLAHESGSVLIRSYHNFECTDSSESLKALVEKCVYHGADMVKIVTMANGDKDVQTVLSLYDKRNWQDGKCPVENGRLIAFCMGEKGRQSRIECLKKGAPFSYASLTDGQETAAGQWSYDEMHKVVYPDFRFVTSGDEGSPALKMPSSKSFAQRAIIAAALAEGRSKLHKYSPCEDSEAALGIARAIGAKVEIQGSDISITGIGAGKKNVDGSLAKMDFPQTIHTGQSGLLTRLMIPLAAQLADKTVTITGEKTLVGRALDGIPDIMDALGAKVEFDGEHCCVPLKVSGPVHNGRIEISGKSGSQTISGLLMSLPFSEKNTTLVVNEPKSIPYMFITLDVLKQFGVRINNEMMGGQDFLESEGNWNLCTDISFKIKGGQSLKAAEIDLEGDWSAAANFLVAGALFGGACLSGLDTSSLQADLSIMDVLMDAGATLSQLDDEKGDIVVKRAPLSPITEDLTHCPDLFPICAVLACFCEGESCLSGTGRLAHKESNRLLAIEEMLDKMDVEHKTEGDKLFIKGQSLAGRCLQGRLLKGGSFSSFHDHRMLMALKVASLGSLEPFQIDDESCAEKSFPDFSKQFELLV